MNYRLNRLFNPASGRCLDIAVDHGFFGGPSFLTGIADMPAWWPRTRRPAHRYGSSRVSVEAAHSPAR
ncbi:hypothetical protein [Micromonospora inositola]|uniref:Aldolase n=1 Tax=Micromonospora inositola TaxID=47865 RepID=A0A1C5JWI2_9ACTN|nr:hypothetical protein [Micromonospora inositola]SCG74944.1 hypothetical protein GA0070613_5656 [Micromonospora inositola]